MRLALFCHSLLSDYGHRSAHFFRGIVTELAARRHDVRVFEKRNASSVEDLVNDHGPKALDLARHTYPRMKPRRYDPATLDLDEVLDGVDLVLVHEPSDCGLVRRVGELRKRPGTRLRALFYDAQERLRHDGHDEEAITRDDLSGYDGVLAFGAAVRDEYLRRGLAERIWVWHEAADPRVFFPRPTGLDGKQGDVVWIGNGVDDDHARVLEETVFTPAKDLGLRAEVFGVRYAAEARARLSAAGIPYRGWIPNFRVPDVLAKFKLTVHLPRRPDPRTLPGIATIPTIRVFEALACGAPLICASWTDAEGLFTVGKDYLLARDAEEMHAHMRLLANEAAARSELARHGRRTILARHTCAHRVDELLGIASQLGIRVRRPTMMDSVSA